MFWASKYLGDKNQTLGFACKVAGKNPKHVPIPTVPIGGENVVIHHGRKKKTRTAMGCLRTLATHFRWFFFVKISEQKQKIKTLARRDKNVCMNCEPFNTNH